ncbi:MAG: voltage-gated potassium channel [Actinomycetota bacterium]|nr:voltage-gated potassium channel [Actinomycetota bacterium]
MGAGALVYSTDGSWDDPSAQPPWIQLEGMVIGNELSRLFRVEERHRRLFARLVVALGLSLVVFVIGTVAMWALESGRKGGDIHGVGDSAFFTAVQLLTVSSSFSNPLTAGGKIVDVFLELWAILVVTAVTGSFATFFTSGDS